MVTTYDYECSDHSGGTIEARSPAEARKQAGAACHDKNGVLTGPEARPWPGHQA